MDRPITQVVYILKGQMLRHSNDGRFGFVDCYTYSFLRMPRQHSNPMTILFDLAQDWSLERSYLTLKELSDHREDFLYKLGEKIYVPSA